MPRPQPQLGRWFRRPATPRPFTRLRLNRLEDREVPATFVVENTNDSGTGSLRAAIAQANENSDPDTITFNPAVFNSANTIMLISGQLSISSPVTITGPGANLLTVTSNFASRAFFVNNSQSLTLSGVTLANNQPSSGDGGAILNLGTLTVTDSALTGNKTLSNAGGAIANNVNGKLTVVNSLLSGNSGRIAGGVSNSGSGGATIVNSTLSGNSLIPFMGNGGSAIYSNSNLEITNTTITGNTAPSVGFAAIRQGGSTTLTLNNTVVAGNLSGGAAGDVSKSGFATVKGNNNLIGPGGSGGLVNGSNGNIVLTDAADAKLGTLADNGGPTQTIALLAGSPAVNAGSNTLAEYASGNPITTDQRGGSFARVVGGTVDIGAFEVGGEVFVVNTTADDDPADKLSLREALALANADAASADTITFDAAVFAGNNVIRLTQGELAVTGAVTLTGTGANKLEVSGESASRVFNVGLDAKATISGLTVSGGFVSLDNGGGIVNFGDLTLSSVWVTGNTAVDGAGGGIDNSGNLTVENSTVSGNTTVDDGNSSNPNGGGLYNTSSGSVTIRNSTISGNASDNHGGGIFNLGTLNLVNATVTGNFAPIAGGGIYDNGTASALNTLIAGNSVVNNGPDFFGTLTGTNSLIGDSANLFLNGSGNIVGVDAATVLNPALDDNGGPTLTHALIADSLALDAGQTSDAPATDQRGVTRPQGDAFDIGAFELEAETPGFVVTTTDDAVYAFDGKTSLREAIILANSNPDANTITFDATVFANASTISLGGTELEITDPVTISGTGITNLTVSGNFFSRVFNVNTGSAVTLSDLTVTGGNTSDNGGGIVSLGDLTLTNVAVDGNSAGGFGGGISLDSPAAVLTITGGSVSFNMSFNDGGSIRSQGAVNLNGVFVNNNQSASGNGGGIAVESQPLTVTGGSISLNTAAFNGGGIYSTGDITLTDGTTVETNTAGNRGGGFDLDSSSASLSITGGSVSYNTASSGGGGGIRSLGTTMLEGVSVNNNNSTDGSGGGIAADTMPLTVTGGSITGNTASTSGGGIFSNGNVTLTDNVTVDANTADNGGGGGIELDSASAALSITGGSVSGNTASSSGGGIRTRGTAVLDVVTVEANRATGGSGGGIHMDSLPLTVTSSTINGNTAGDAGGGIFANGNVTVSGGTTVDNNTATSGGGISLNSSTATLDFTGGTIKGNKATSGSGGGFSASGPVVLSQTTVSNNQATGNGGGIQLNNGSVTATLTDVTVSGNSAESGGGINSSSKLSFTRVTISGNTATQSGGGLISRAASTLTNVTISGNSANSRSGGIEFTADLKLVNSTVTGNRADANGTGGGNGGGVYRFNGTTDWLNTIVAGNFVGTGTTASDVVGSITGFNNLIGSATGLSGLTDGVNGNIVGVDAATVLNPTLADNGGTTKTHALIAGSKALDAGKASGAPATDQRGVARPEGNAFDIGAFELEAETPGLVVNTLDGAVNPFDGKTSLREAINLANSNADANTITFDATVFANASTITLNGTELEITNPVTISGTGITNLTVSGNNLSRVFNVNTGSAVTLSDLTVTCGNTSGNGGGIVSLGDLTLTNVAVDGNSAGGFGGGISIDSTAAVLTITGGSVSFNMSLNDGGGISSQGAVSLNGVIVNTNQAAGGNGGGIAADSMPLTVTGGSITGNTAAFNGGGINADGDVTVTGNAAVDANTAGHGSGGGINLTSSATTLSITGGSVSGNTASSSGGGIRTPGTVILDNVTVDNNKSTGSSGGGIHMDSQPLTVTGGTINGNTAFSSGGGIFASGNVTVSGGTAVDNNTANSGGGIQANGSTATLDFTGGSVSGNQATNNDGGGITAAGTLILSQTTVSNNQSAGNGGGLQLNNSSVTATLTDVTVSGNSAQSGGGIRSSSPLALTRVTISGNTATESGGGLISRAASTLTNVTISGNSANSRSGGIEFTADLKLVNSTVTGNRADADGTGGGNGGGVYRFGGATDWLNTIVAGNFVGTGTTASDVVGSITGFNNLIGTGGSGGLTDGVNGNIVGVDAATVLNPTLADNGGTTKTHALIAGSKALDAGKSAGAPATDQRGVARPEGNAFDIGAFELEAETPGLVVNTFNGAVNAFDGLTSLGDAIAFANSNPDANTITFDATVFANASTITLGGSELVISSAVTIAGTGINKLTVSGNNLSRVFHVASGTVAISDLTVTAGKVTGQQNGGAILNDSTLSLTDVAVTDSRAIDEGNGGGISNGGALTLTRVIVSGNLAEGGVAGAGGGLYNSNNGSATITASTFSDNTAGEGGAIYVQGTLLLVNSTLSGNTADTGGGIYNFGTLTARNVTVTGNRGTGQFAEAGGIDTRYRVPVLTNTIVSGNFLGATGTTAGDVAGSFTGSNNLIGGTALLGELGDHGGPVPTIPLLPGSPAINAGTTGGDVPTADARGITRDTSPDIGAFESRGFTLTYVSGDDQKAGKTKQFASPLVVRVSSDFGEPVVGGVVTFTGPASGAGLDPATVTATVTSDGMSPPAYLASATVTANSDIGAYQVNAAATGAPAAVAFALENIVLTPVNGVTLDNGTGGQRSMVRSITLKFDTPQPANAVTKVSVARVGGLTGTLVLSGALDAAGTALTVTFSGTAVTGKSLPDGRYTLSYDNFQLLDGTEFFRFFGDINGDAKVNDTDQAAFKLAMDTRRGVTYSGGKAYNEFFDFNSDNYVNSRDQSQFNSRFGLVLP